MKCHRGLALYAVLLTAGLLAALVLLTASRLIPEVRASWLSERQTTLKIGTQHAARRALAELQTVLGRDCGATFMDGDKGLSRTGPASAGVRVGGVLGEMGEGGVRWSWSLEDLSQEYDEAAAFASAVQSSGWAGSSPGRQKLAVGPLTLELPVAARRALELGDRTMFAASAELAEPLGTGWGHFGLLTNPVHGGFKTDLADAGPLGAEFGPAIAARLRDESMLRPPASGAAVFKDLQAGRRLMHLPVLADFRLSLGLFNSRSDGRHRLRFHVSGLWWNPSSFPLLANAQHRLFLAELGGAPEVTVANLDSGASFTTSLDDAPRLDLGVLQQGLRERGLWFWADISDKNRHGMIARGLLPGEVYGFTAPGGQSQGLARILTAQTWKYDDAPHGPTWKRPSPLTFRPDDRIQINVRFPERTSIHLRPAGPDPERDQLIADYPLEPIAGVEGIPFPDFQILTTGRDYSREDSKGYVISERRACLRLRLRPRPLGEFLDAVDAVDMLRPEWDLRNPAELAEWVVDNPLTAALDDEEFAHGPEVSMLWDAFPDAHEADKISAFASVRVRDIPLEPRVSVGTFRHLEGKEGRLWVPLMDRTYLSALVSPAEAGVASHNPRIVEAVKAGIPQEGEGMASLHTASRWVVRGTFNVNSRSVDAWRRLMSRSQFSWRADGGGPFTVGDIKGAPLFTLPSGAGAAQWAARVPMNLADSVLRESPADQLSALSASQSVRELGAEAIARLAAKIVELQPGHGWPYVSLQAFAESGLLRDAIREARLNEFLPVGSESSRIYLTEADFLETFAPMLAVRGDTFRIIARAEALEPGGGYYELELIAQRTYAMHDAAFLGRRFRIVSAKIRR